MCDEKVSGLGADLLAAFFSRMLDTLGQFQNSDALYLDYVDFCRARDAEPAAMGVFCEEITRLVVRVKEVLL
jgi:hypothetical protein